MVSTKFLAQKTIGKKNIFSIFLVSRNVFKKGDFCQFLASNFVTKYGIVSTYSVEIANKCNSVFVQIQTTVISYLINATTKRSK